MYPSTCSRALCLEESRVIGITFRLQGLDCNQGTKIDSFSIWVTWLLVYNTLPYKAKRQHLFTSQVSRYCLLALQIKCTGAVFHKWIFTRKMKYLCDVSVLSRYLTNILRQHTNILTNDACTQIVFCVIKCT